MCKGLTDSVDVLDIRALGGDREPIRGEALHPICVGDHHLRVQVPDASVCVKLDLNSTILAQLTRLQPRTMAAGFPYGQRYTVHLRCPR